MRKQSAYVGINNLLFYYLGNDIVKGGTMVHIYKGNYRRGDIFFICTDGITELIDKDTTKSLLSKNTINIEEMFDVITSKDPADNCTGIILKIS